MRPILPAAVALTLGFLVTACNEQPTMPDASASAIPVSAAEHATPVVSVTGLTEHGGHDEGADPHHHQFLIDKTELQAGWTTFRFHNEADVTHFVAVQRLPEEAGDITLEEYVAAVTEPFQEFFDLWLEGAENPFSAFADTPGWFFDPGITFMGGPGLTGPGLSSETTVNLKPGRYVVECYVKSDDDVFHSAAGMIEMLTVSETASEAPEPEADIEINISQAGGIEIVSIPRPHPIRHRSILPRQDYTIAVHFEDQAAYENLVQHDLHLARLTGDADLGELGAWMNWFSEDGFKRSVPEGVEFVGGTQEMPAGQTAYFTANFTEDRYVLVAEIPNPRDKGMLKTITVPLWWFGTN